MLLLDLEIARRSALVIRGGKSPWLILSNMAEVSAVVPSLLMATDCPNVVTVTTKATNIKVFHNHWFILYYY
jgi:hypothetical protein